MEKLRIGIIKETTKKDDKRVPLTPRQCADIEKQFPFIELFVEPCDIRCYSDDDYSDFGIEVTADLSHCDVLLGIKEVAVEAMIANKTYFFFSHTIKKQARNKAMLQAILEKNITLIDYETLTNNQRQRIIGFGRYAGLIGAYNGVLGYGKKYDLFDIKPAHQCRDRKELERELERVKLTNLKICVTGGGRVASGAEELLALLKVRKTVPYDYLHSNFREAVYVQLHSKDYNTRISDGDWDAKEFYTNPQGYQSAFGEYATVTDLLITCHYWNPAAPLLFTPAQMAEKDFRMSVIADVTCDINGSVPSTFRASSIDEPFYGYNPHTQAEGDPFATETITVMAVDNLPCELPRDASEDFGNQFIAHVLPEYLNKSETIARATIAHQGQLTTPYQYLQTWVEA